MKTLKREDKLKKLKQGEGTFVYQGGAYDTESAPGVPLLGKDGHQVRVPILTEVEAADGRKVHVVDPKSDGKGELVWKKAPQFNRIELKSYRIRIPGVAGSIVDGELVAKPDANGKTPALWLEFPKGKPVFVGDPLLALKLRAKACMREVDGEALAGGKDKDSGKGEKSDKA